MLAVQFKIRHGQLVWDSFQIYRYENEHSVGNINEVVFNEGGVQNSELYFENSNNSQSSELDDRHLAAINKGKEDLVKVHCTTFRMKKPYMKVRRSIHLDGYCISRFCQELKMSNVYRSHVLKFHCEVFSEKPVTSGLTQIYIEQEQPKSHLLDYTGSKILDCLLHKRIELEHAMAWLSTLGGAFSALGDNQIHCAKVAGRISVQQFRIAMELGDEDTVTRCILYYGLSLVQRGYFKQARKVIENQYNLAKKRSCVDSRIFNICHGIWAKLKYERMKHRTPRF